jgi:beta-aspartyl-peptidase (threonine type)
MAKKFGIIVHGGAGPDSDHIHKNEEGYRKGIEEAIKAGYEVLEKGGSAIDAVEAAVNSLENNPLFNAGRGSAINAKGEVEMCASIMDGKTRNSGSVVIVKNVKNPVSLAKAVMMNTDYISLGAHGALDYARRISIQLEPDSYFVTEHQYDVYEKKRKDEFLGTREIAEEQVRNRMHGTVGAVALDQKGNLAAATSTGGTENSKEGRVGDSGMLGIGTFANNETCAVSCTGDGEYIIRGVLAHSIASAMKYRGVSVKEACKYVIHEENAGIKGDIGAIGIDKDGNFCAELNSARMHRGWRTSEDEMEIYIYNDEDKEERK